MAFGCFVWSSLCVQSYNCHDLKPNTLLFFFFQAEDGRRDGHVTGVQTCALPISRVRAEVRAKDGEPVEITEHFKPGIEEIAAVLPPAWARRLLAWGERTGRLGKTYFSMHLRSTTVLGFLRLRL